MYVCMYVSIYLSTATLPPDSVNTDAVLVRLQSHSMNPPRRLYRVVFTVDWSTVEKALGTEEAG